MPDEARSGTADEGALLAREFLVFARYLGARTPPARLIDHYRRMHPAALSGPVSRLDERLVALARWSPLAAGLADSYARLARPYGLLRRKLTLTLALLESAAGTHAYYDTANPAPPLTAWFALAALGAAWAMRTLVAVIVIAPIHLFSGSSAAEALDHG